MAPAQVAVVVTRTFALGATLAGALLLLAPREIAMPKLLVWNASGSAPIGLYRVDGSRTARVGDRVMVDPEPDIAAFLDERHYLAKGTPLIKTLAAAAPSRVCRIGSSVIIDGRPVAEALRHDRRGRLLPAWSGCVDLSADTVFLLTADVRDSLDGRYFGVSLQASIRGRALPLLVRERRP